jgi:hypothetical protein
MVSLEDELPAGAVGRVTYLCHRETRGPTPGGLCSKARDKERERTAGHIAGLLGAALLTSICRDT